jgi:hypothetical protein
MPRIYLNIRFIGNGAVLGGVSARTARTGPRRRVDAPFPRKGKCGKHRLVARVRASFTKNTDASLVVRPTQGPPFWHMAGFRVSFETREKAKFRTKPIRTKCATATRCCRQEAAGLAIHCAHCIVKRFCDSPPRLVPGRRVSCGDRVP